ncbi:MAG: sigma-54-dependent Fis family transcriptional regulator [Desulfobacterales bacterium]|nr:sigma-54-dependent Fis family transcriptional regulator [Desulfobacterales bacterium]MBF0396513.1 sigma-54-dependent Fis family transcriptional regulator [Desulfobacterales bacterium]
MANIEISNDESAQTILIVDDDLHILEVLEARLSSAGFNVFKAVSPHEAINILKTKSIDLIISDMKMPEMGGMGFLKEVRNINSELPLIFLTAYGTIPDAVDSIKAGAIEYFTKPFDGRELIKKINNILKDNQHLSARKFTSASQGFYVGENSAMNELVGLIEKVAVSDVNLLILGESGVGKERAAHLVHELGPRRDNPFIVVDCGSTPTSLLESELFGHVKGSFTHAIRDKKGLIEAANGGTLFLDEIGNISLEMQMRLLRFLEDRKIRKIGDIKEISVDCRIIAATNANLLDEIKAGRFREDLYYRLRVVTLKFPPLRERKEEIPFLVENFVKNFCKNKGLQQIKLPQKTIDFLCSYHWPGNVRELKNSLEAGVVLCKNGVLLPEDLNISDFQDKNNNMSKSNDPFSLEESERNTIIRALQETEWVQKDAADLLGISRRTIHYKIKKFGIKIEK